MFGAGGGTRTHEGFLRRLTRAVQSPLCDTGMFLTMCSRRFLVESTKGWGLRMAIWTQKLYVFKRIVCWFTIFVVHFQCDDLAIPL